MIVYLSLLLLIRVRWRTVISISGSPYGHQDGYCMHALFLLASSGAIRNRQYVATQSHPVLDRGLVFKIDTDRCIP